FFLKKQERKTRPAGGGTRTAVRFPKKSGAFRIPSFPCPFLILKESQLYKKSLEFMNDGNSQNEISEPLISMEEIKSDSTPQHRLISVESDAVLSKPVKSKRVASLDIFRGLTVALMILVDDAGGDWPMIGHAPWFGCNLADFVMPFFLFIVGMAIALALKRIPNQLKAIEKVTLRTLKLLFWGLLLQGGYSHAPDKLTYGVDMRKIRLCGILQRIALAYLVVALVEVACGVRGSLDPPCNAVGYIDRKVLGIRHMYAHPAWRRSEACTENSPYAGPFRNNAPSWCFAPFEPEGILSSISAILSSIIGVHFGHVLIHFQDHSARLKQWVTMGFTLLILGLVLHFTHAIPLNKQLYTFSYVCVTSGAAALVFSVFYALVLFSSLNYF
ncbi:Heparan-alpha-glucosaminide N-acetyltransferase, partial [Cucurbita argyrosperma subsp. argyrosperma]